MTSETNVNELFQNAVETGSMSQVAQMTLSAPDIGAQIQTAMGVSADELASSEIFLLTQLVDDSSSIKTGGNAQSVRDGHNLVLEALRDSDSEDDVLAHTRYLNGQVLFPYSFIGNTVPLDSSNYDPRLGTPLYDQAVVVLGSVMAKEREYMDAGIMVRTATLLVTDGMDLHSKRHGAADVRQLVKDMLARENHIVAAMGIGETEEDKEKFREIFREMGLHDHWILTPKNSASEIRNAFGTFSKASQTASQGSASFSNVADSGFAGI